MANSSKQRIQLSPAPQRTKRRKKVAEPSAYQQSPTQNSHVAPDFRQSELSPETVIHLQRLIGNQATIQMLDKQKQSSKSLQRLPDQLQGVMGNIFDANLSDVNIHSDDHADHIARSANTNATTIGNNIYFQKGAYRPGTASGNALIAREVAHIQRAKLTGSPNTQSSTETSEAAKHDAEQVGGLVQMMGADPAQTVRPMSKTPTVAQRRLLQRAGYSKARVGGVVTSKVLQGIFTTVLGPVGLVWRWPLIQKNLGEITGWEQFGSRKGKTDKEGNLVDKMRYGNSPLGTAMRWMAGISEVLKEFTIWLGFGTFIAAIVTAATHGAAAPVFLGLSIATAVTAGLHFALRSLLVSLNGYRLWRATKDGKTDKLPFIKHQMISDGVEGIGAGLSALFGGLGAGGVSSAGGALASAAGHGSGDSAGKLAGFGLGAVTQGLGTSVVTNTAKEGGKDAVKPDSATGFIGMGSKAKDDWGGFGKDAVEIKNAYKGLGSKKTRGFKIGKSTKGKVSQDPSPQPTAPLSNDSQQLLIMVSDIKGASTRNTIDQIEQRSVAQTQDKLVGEVTPKANKTAEDVGTIQQNIGDTQNKAEDLKGKLPDLVDQSVKDDPNALNDLQTEVDKGLQKANEPTIPKDPTENSGDDSKINLARADVQRKGGIKAWFMKKLSGVKAGISRLNNKVLAGVMKFAGKFNKAEGDRKSVATAMAEEKNYTAKEVKDELANDALFAEFQGKADQLAEGANTLVEMENQ